MHKLRMVHWQGAYEFWPTIRVLSGKALFIGKIVMYRLRPIHILIMQEIEEIESPHQTIAHMLKAILLLDEAKNRT